MTDFCDAPCQEGYEAGCCCYHTDLNETQGYICQGCAEYFGEE